jgi:ribonuclease BN (tRNA processing enzyme)
VTQLSLTYSQSINLKPIRKGEYYCFDLPQTKEIALLVLNDESNNRIITHQEELIFEYKNLIINSDETILQQSLLLQKKDKIIDNSKKALENTQATSNLEIKKLKKIHRKQVKKLVLVVVVESILVICVLILK